MATDGELRAAAAGRLEELRGFYIHLSVYLSVNAGLFFLWMLNGGGRYWPVWALFGWGIGLALHAMTVFVGQRLPAEIRVYKEMNRIQRHGPTSAT